MGVDIAVTFTPSAGIETVAAAIIAAGVNTDRMYVIYRSGYGSPRLTAFSLWGSPDVDLGAICKELSRQCDRVFTLWKSEHAGVAGYAVYDRGEQGGVFSTADENYLEVPIRSFERLTGLQVQLSPLDRLSFPESLFDESSCAIYALSAGIPVVQPVADLQRLREFDLDAEPILPV